MSATKSKALKAEDLEEFRKYSPVLDYMIRHGEPLTRDVYITIATMGNPGYKWTSEDEADMPEPLQDPAMLGGD